MKLAIISDIHSNIEALEACHRVALEQGVEGFACLGDMIGYGADPVAVLDLIQSLPGLIVVRGNHDNALLSKTYKGVWSPIQQAIEWTYAQLSPAHIEFINNLPFIHEEFGATFVHASAANPRKWEYLFMPEQAKDCMSAANTNVTFIGHVHVPGVFYETPTQLIRKSSPEEGISVPLHREQRYVINVGSVGQPRDGDPAACFVIYDSDVAEFSFHRVIYDHTRTAKKILAAGLDPLFAARLAGAY